MAKIKRIAMVMGLLGFCYQAGAVVTPVNVVLHDGSTTYNIPSGKVLIIEHFIWALEGASTSQTISITPANDPGGVGDFQLKFSATKPDSWTPPRPIRIAGGSGAKVSIFQNAVVNWRDVMIVGLLVDASDLYAANIPLKLSNPMVTGDRLVADVEFSSPRPHVVSVLSSDDLLSSFSSDVTGELSESPSPVQAVASVKANTDEKFMRVVATARME